MLPHPPALMTLALTLITGFSSMATQPASAEEPSPTPIDLTQEPLTIAFFGDSITHAGEYHQWVQLYLLTRYPGHDIWTFNGGYAGENTRGVLAKDYLNLDIFPQQPDVILINLGMNDFDLLSYTDLQEEPSDAKREKKRDQYRSGMTKIVEDSLAYGAAVGILSPTIYDDTHKNNKHFGNRPHANAELGRFAVIAREVAESFDSVFFIDLHTPMDEMTTQKQATNPKFSLARDRVHPSNGGNELMAFEILQGLDARTLVYDVELTAEGQARRAEGVTVGGLEKIADGVRFELIESALLFPTAAVTNDFEVVPMDEKLNAMRLAVTDLPAGQYALEIDGIRVGVYPHDQWAAGVDLSTNTATPQYQAAVELAEQVKEQKLPLQRAMADMRSLRFQLLFKKEPENEGLVWEWDEVEPAKIVDAANRLYDRLVAEDKKPGGWGSYVFNNGRKAWANYDQIKEDLGQLRTEWAARPTEFRRDYRVFGVDPS